MIMAKGGSSSLVILTSRASGRINALFSVRTLRILMMLINTFVLLLFLPFRGRRQTSSISPKDDAKNYRKGMPVRRRAGPTTVTIDQQVLGRTALAISHVLQDEDQNCVRDFSLFNTPRGNAIFTQSWTPAADNIRLAISFRIQTEF